MVVLGIGNACLDTLLRVERLPEAGGKVTVLERQSSAGGQVAGALAGCVRLGLAARMALRTGDDYAGAQVRAALQAAGVSLEFGRVLAGVPTATAVILRDGAGERMVVWSTDPGLAVAEAELTPALFAGVDGLLLDGRDHPASLAAARQARASGMPVVGDLDCHYAHTPALLPWVDHLVVPESFDPPAPLPGQTVVVTRGAAGAVASDGGAWIASPAFPVAVLDTTGAGDAFHAGYLYALLRAWPLPQRLRFANACAALACTAVGALAGLPSLARVEALLAQHPAGACP